MLRGLQNRIDDVLHALGGDEDAFNCFAEAERLGIFLRHGRLYPSAIGQTHTGRLARELLCRATPETPHRDSPSSA
jgi:hypothetical protein